MLNNQLIYRKLLQRFGDLHWWPADSEAEILFGTILTQNTTWKNVETAILSMKRNSLIDLERVACSEQETLENSIRSSGYFRQKAGYIKQIASSIIGKYHSLAEMHSSSTEELISFFSAERGVGRETLDSILLYLFNRRTFVVDAYTRRIFNRIGYPDSVTDEFIRKSVTEDSFSVEELKNYHACLVELAKKYCMKTPACNGCPLSNDCNYEMVLSSP